MTRSPHVRCARHPPHDRRRFAPPVDLLQRGRYGIRVTAADPYGIAMGSPPNPTGVKRLFALLTGVAPFRHTPLSPSRHRGGTGRANLALALPWLTLR